MPTCVIKGCKNRPEINKHRGITFHRFPIHKPELMKDWLKSIGAHALKDKIKVIHNTSIICSNHFEKCYLKNDKKRTRLEPSAVPTIFNIIPSVPRKKKQWVLKNESVCIEGEEDEAGESSAVDADKSSPVRQEESPSREDAKSPPPRPRRGTKRVTAPSKAKAPAMKSCPVEDDDISLLCLSPSALTQQVIIVPEVPECSLQTDNSQAKPSATIVSNKRKLKIPSVCLDNLLGAGQDQPAGSRDTAPPLPSHDNTATLEKVVILRAKSRQFSDTGKHINMRCPRNIPAQVIKDKRKKCKTTKIAKYATKKKSFYTITKKKKNLQRPAPKDEVVCVPDVFAQDREVLDGGLREEWAQQFSQLCRLCAAGSPPMLAIFTEQGRQQKLADKIHRYLPIKVVEGERLPLQVCGLCLDRLNACEEFSECSQEADLKLRLLLDADDMQIEVEEMLIQKSQIEEEPKSIKQELEVKSEPIDCSYLCCADCGKNFNDFKLYSRHCYTVHKRKKCKNCDQFFISREDLTAHKIQVHGIKCDCCGASFISINAQLSHLRKEHPDFKACTCELCGKSFNSKYGLAIHKECHQIERPFLCDTCGKSFKSKRKLKIHKCVSNPNPTLPPSNTCLVCGNVYTLRSSLKRHMIRHKGERRFECQICNKRFFGSIYLKNHMVIHEKATLFECQMCCARYFHKRNMISHLKNKHSSPWTYKCPSCDQLFQTIDDVVSHRKIHDIENIAAGISQVSDVPTGSTLDFQCRICDKYFENIYVLTYHFEDHVIRNQEDLNIKSIGEDGIFECNYCGVKIASNWIMKRHIKKYHNETLSQSELIYECEYCSKKFASKQQLRTHIWMHTGEKPYRCRYCNSGFRTHLAVRIHSRKHTGETPYHCQKCPKKFRSTATLKVHQVTHDRDKPFMCPHCGQKFLKRSSYKKHVLLHTGDEGESRPQSKRSAVHKCKSCDFVSKTKAALKKHEATHIEPAYFNL